MSTKALMLSLLLAVLSVSPRAGAAAGAPAIAGTSAAPSEKNSSEATGIVSGTVKDTSGAVLQGARIVLKPTTTTVATDAQGNFAIQDVKPGTYTATISYVGFNTSETTVVVIAGKATPLDITMTVGAANQQVVVSANLQGDVAEINETRTSENILNVQTDVQIQSLPNANIADALGRMPGVTLQRNEGEGQYVQIRGTEPRLSNTTIDGVIVPGPDPEVRQVDLDTIPADLVGSVAINKTLSASQDGDAIGGSVDLRIKQATSDQPTLTFESQDGYTPIDNGRKAFLIDSSAGMRFGPDKRWGVMLGYSYDYNGRGIDDVEPVPNFDGPNNSFTFDQLYVQQYLYDRTRYGMAGALDYKLNEGSDLYVHGLFSNFRDYGEKFAYQLTEGGNAKYHTSVRRPNLQIADLAMGGNHVFNRSFLRYQIAASHSRFGGAAGNPGAAFKSKVNDCAFAPGPSEYRPQYTCDVAGDPIFDPTNYKLTEIDLTSGQATQLNLQASGAMGINYHLGTHASTLEFGGQIRNEHKGQDAYSPTYDNFASGAAAPLMSQFLGTFTNSNFYGGSYHLGPVTSFGNITGWLSANPGVLLLDEPATHLGSDASNYNLQERVSAGYIMNTLDISSRLHLQTGLRIEATQTSNTGYLVIDDTNGNYVSTTPQYGSGSYVNPLPSAQLRYTFDGNADIRAVYGRGISRPDPYQLVPYITEDHSTAPYTINIGNTALVAEHANDYDILYEKYLPSVGMIEAGYFYKQITRPIFSEQSIIAPAGSPLSSAYAGDLVLQEVNGDHAHVQGVEFAYQQHMTYLPGVLSGARINANVTYTESRNYNLLNRTDSPALVGQAPLSWNIGPSYATKRAVVTMGVSHNGANIYAYQYQSTGPGAQAPGGAAQIYEVTGPFGDNYFYSHTQVDAKATYYLGKGFTAEAIGENMNNAVFGFYNGSPQYMVQREYYKPTYSGGVRWTQHHE
jgi:TonB-dependent receptor